MFPYLPLELFHIVRKHSSFSNMFSYEVYAKVSMYYKTCNYFTSLLLLILSDWVTGFIFWGLMTSQEELLVWGAAEGH